jgi:hypothetical protein
VEGNTIWGGACPRAWRWQYANWRGVEFAQGWPRVRKHILSVGGSKCPPTQSLHVFELGMRSKCHSWIDCEMRIQYQLAQ